MAKQIALLVFGVILAAGLYALWDTLSSVWSLSAAGAQVLASPAPAKPSDPAPVAVDPTTPLTGIGATFKNSLLILKDGTLQPITSAQLTGVKYWAFYYSASWCPPCRAFTPKLVQFYRDFKASHPQFELIFVSQDRSDDAMRSYMRDDDMPWPAVHFSDIQDPGLNAGKYCGPGIPCLVLVDANGQVLADSFQGNNYLGPQHVVDEIESIVK